MKRALKESFHRLRTEQNTPKTSAEILECADVLNPPHQALTIAYEHGQHWITCNDCGAQWSAIDSIPGPFTFEQVTDGDHFCEETL